MKEHGGPVGSIEQLQRRVPSIVRSINADPRLALRAAANPLLMLEELGYEIPADLRPGLERRIRHRPEDAARLEQLEKRICKLAGEEFDVRSPGELSRILFEKLKLPTVPMVQQLPLQRTVAAPPRAPTEVPYQTASHPKRPDPLEALRGAHRIIEPLLEYRAIEASQPPFASRELYDKLRRGEPTGPTFQIRTRLRRGPPPE